MAEVASPARNRVPIRFRGGTVPGEITYLRHAEAGSRTSARPVVVLIHGVGMHAGIWAPQIPALRAAGWDVIALDMPGHGGSSLPPVAPTLSDYADAVIGLLDGLEIGRASLVGHSMGALVATATALDHPDRVAGLVAMNAVFCRPPDLKRAVLARAAELDARGLSASVEPTIARWFGDPVADALRPLAELAAASLRSVDPEGYRRTYRLFASSDEALAPGLPGLVMPALFFTADGDANSTPSMSREMAALAPHGAVRILAGARHMMALTHPDEVNDALLSFLQAQDGR